MNYFIKYHGIILYDDGPLIPLEEGFEFLDCEHALLSFRKKHGREVGIFHNKVCYKQGNGNRLFKRQPYCACCGLKAQGWKLVCNSNPKILKKDIWTLNLFAEVNGELIEFTRDHIIPKSRGGNGDISNFQTLCFDCNNLKGNMSNDKFLIKYNFMKGLVGCEHYYQPELF